MTATIWGHQSSAQARGQTARWSDHRCRAVVFVPTPGAFRAVARIQSVCSCELIPQQPDHEFPRGTRTNSTPAMLHADLATLLAGLSLATRVSLSMAGAVCACAVTPKPHCSWDYRIERPRVMSQCSRKISTIPTQSVLTASCLPFFANTEDTSTCPSVAFSG